MLLEMLMWGFFSYWGWQLGDYVKDKIVDPPAQTQKENKDRPGKD